MVFWLAVTASLLVLFIAIGCGDDTSKQDKEEVKVFLHQSMNSFDTVRKQTDFSIKKINFVRSMKTNGSIDVPKYHQVINEETELAQKNLDNYYRIDVPNVRYTKGKYSESQDLVKDCYNHMYNAMNQSVLKITDTYMGDDTNPHNVGVMKEMEAYQTSMKKLNDLYDLQMVDDNK